MDDRAVYAEIGQRRGLCCASKNDGGDLERLIETGGLADRSQRLHQPGGVINTSMHSNPSVVAGRSLKGPSGVASQQDRDPAAVRRRAPLHPAQTERGFVGFYPPPPPREP